MTFNDFFGRPVDYEIHWGLEEWVDDKYRTTDDFCRLEIGTEKMQEFLKEKFGKTVPLNSVISTTPEEMREIMDAIHEEKTLCGTFGSLRAKAFDIDCFYTKGKDGIATEEELNYDYKWNEL